MKKYLDSINLTFKFGTMIDEMMKIYPRRISLIYFEDNEKYIIVFLFNELQLKFGNKKIKLLLKYYFEIDKII